MIFTAHSARSRHSRGNLVIMTSSSLVGFIIAATAVVSNGSFAMFFKKFEHSIDLNAFLIYFGFGAGSAWWIVILFLPYNNPPTEKHLHFTPTFCTSDLGVGFILAACFYMAFTAIKMIGLATAQGVFAGVNLTVSFLVGAVWFGDIIAKPAFAVTN